MAEGDVVCGASLDAGMVAVVVVVVPVVGGGSVVVADACCLACTEGDNECNSGVCSRGEPKGESKGECKAVCIGE